MTDERTLYDVEEEKINFLNNFLIEQCFRIEPELDVESLITNRKLVAVQAPNEQYYYFFNKKIPLLYLDLKLLIDGT